MLHEPVALDNKLRWHNVDVSTKKVKGPFFWTESHVTLVGDQFLRILP